MPCLAQNYVRFLLLAFFNNGNIDWINLPMKSDFPPSIGGEDCIAFVWLTEEPIFTTASQRLAFLLRSLQSRFPSQSYRRAPVPLKFCKASRQRQIFDETKFCHHAVCVDVTNHSWTSCYMFHFHGNFPQNIDRLGNYWVLRKSVYMGIWSRRPLAGRIWPIRNMHVC